MTRMVYLAQFLWNLRSLYLFSGCVSC